MSNSEDYTDWTDSEIEEYLKSFWECDEFVFDCKFDTTPYKTKTPEKFKGSIRQISLNRKFICYPGSKFPIYFNIPSFIRNSIEPGNYKLRFELDTRDYRERIGNMFLLKPDYKSLRELNEEKLLKINQIKAEHGKDNFSRKEKELFERWGVNDCTFIGFYHYDVDNNISTINDIRKPNFAHIPYYPEDPEKAPIVITYEKQILGIKSDDYYLFNWKLSNANEDNPYEIFIDFDFQPQPIRPAWFIKNLFEDRYGDKSKNFESSANFLDTLSKQLSAKESTFIYELLQNADDYPVPGNSVDVEFHITDNYLLILHSGDYFNVRNISGICGINEKEKSANKKTIGYKGIGFKTVFLNNHYVYIQTGDYSFRFEEKAKVIKRLEAPWPILPIWTDPNTLTEEVKNVFDKADPKFRVKIALRPDDPSILHSGRKNYETLFKDVFEDSNLILFTNNIRSVKVFIGNSKERDCTIDNNKWLVSSYTEPIDEDFQKLVNKDIDTGKSRIPEKYKDFSETKISFACKKEGRKLITMDDSHLYCYLPTSASWGFPFLLNTDMIPKGDRDDIEREVYLKDEDETNFNLELTKIAGQKFFCWIQELIQSGKYDYDSIFSLIPDFEKCIETTDEKYEDFIECFKEGFESQLEKAELIPVVIENELAYKPVSEIIFDTTGLSCSGIMSDTEILTFSRWTDYFPHEELRDYDKKTLRPGIKSFLKRYRDDRQIYSTDTLLKAVQNKVFKDWLRTQENNDKFLKLLIDQDIIDKFKDSQIFLSEKKDLNEPCWLYYTVDDFYDKLSALDVYFWLDRLSLQTRKMFEGQTNWDNFKDNFGTFEPNDFVNNTLLSEKNRDEAFKILSKKENSIAFLDFLSSNVTFKEDHKQFPFIDCSDKTINSFVQVPIIFAYSNEAEDLRSMKWIDEEWIGILNPAYNESIQSYLKKNYGIKDYSDEIIIKNIICNDLFKEDINKLIGDFSSNKSFMDFAFTNREFIDDNGLSGFLVSTVDADGDESFASSDDEYIFLRNQFYKDVESEIWIDKDLLSSVNALYFKNLNSEKEYRLFISEKYNIPEMDLDLFLNDIVFNKSVYINTNIEDETSNIAFWRWTKSIKDSLVSLDKFNVFKLLVKELDDTEYSTCTLEDNGIYLSNAYRPSSGIESIVKKYAPNALFVGDVYLEDNNYTTINEWVDFFKTIGLKTTIIDLVFSKIIPNLEDIEEDGLPNLLGQYYLEIQDQWESVLDNDQTVLENLKKIKVKTKDGLFTPINDCILIDSGKDAEPFQEITIDKQVADIAFSNRNAKKLLLDIAEECNSKVITSLSQWQETKLDIYTGNEESYDISTHTSIVSEMSVIDLETLNSFPCLAKLKLLNSDDEYKAPQDLTLGCTYKTSCLFDRYGATEGLDFLSFRYTSCSDLSNFLNLLKKSLKVHFRFEKEDGDLLKGHKFAEYFWTDYAPRHQEFIVGLIEDGFFKERVCIPTIEGNVYSPAQIYSRAIKDYVVDKIPDWRDKLPSETIPINENEDEDLINKLNLKDHLNFIDCISALHTIKGKERRRKILQWMKEEYTDSDEDLVLEYRKCEDAIWKNGKAQDKPLSELYALAPDSKTLWEFFRDNENVINSDYFLSDAEDYRGICNILQIPIIEESQMTFEANGVQQNLAKYFEGRHLVVSAIEDPDNWKENFKNYKEAISKLHFWKCTEISWTFKEKPEICQNTKKFYNKDNDLYFVKDWCTKQVYSDFLETLKSKLECEINKDTYNTILDPDEVIEDLLHEYYSIRTDAFITELAKYDNTYNTYDGPKANEEVDEEDIPLSSANIYNPQKKHVETGIEEQETSDNAPEDKSMDSSSKSIINADPNDEFKENKCSTNITESQKSETNSDTQTNEGQSVDQNKIKDNPSDEEKEPESYEFDPDQGEVIGDITNDDNNFEPVGTKPRTVRQARRRAAKPFTKEERERLRSNGVPLELESLPATKEELDILSQCGISPEQIADTNYLAQLRLYRNLQEELREDPEESLSEFIRNADDVSEHKMKSGKYIHACSAARGVMYVSPSVWNKMLDDKWIICVYLDGRGKNFHYINDASEFLALVQKDDVVIKITGQEKVNVVNDLYSGLLENVKGTAYTLVRVASRTNMDAVFAHYVGSMAEQKDGNEDEDLNKYW